MKIAVIGAGWAGCAAAVELVQNGQQVTLFEAKRTLGGRARCVNINQMRLDNGQHILLGAYQETLHMMRTVGLDPATLMLRLPLQLCYPADGIQFSTPRLPAPWHLLCALVRARGLNYTDKLALARFFSAARWMEWVLHHDCSVNTLLERFDQTAQLIQYIWRPLCIAALNTHPAQASAKTFMAVLRDSLGAQRNASDMLLPRQDLSRLFPEHAATFIQARGSNVQVGCSITRIQRQGHRWQLLNNTLNVEYDAVIVATPPFAAALLLEEHISPELLRQLHHFQYQPITTCYLQYANHACLPRPFFALQDDAENNAQFVFDRGYVDSAQRGLFAAIISAIPISCDHVTLSQIIAHQLATAFHMPVLREPIWSQVITEKRATFVCTPDLFRPDNISGLEKLLLAGDYTVHDYPATLESAIQSGRKAARLLLA